MTLKWLPNVLTLARCALAFVVGWLILGLAEDPGPAAFILFVLVAASDFVDGMAARALNAVSALGALLDPIADKLLVALSLLALCQVDGWPPLLAVPALVIIARDILVTLARLRPGIILPVSPLAKQKTAFEMVGIAVCLVAFALPALATWLQALGLGLIWLAAALSVLTGGQYARAFIAAGRR